MQATAEIKYIRISDRKLRDLSRKLKGMSAQKALKNLNFTPTKGARLLIKAIESAVANATNTHKMNGDAIQISRIEILKGPFFKRWNPVSRGMAHGIKKRTSHIKIVLTDNKQPFQKTQGKQITNNKEPAPPAGRQKTEDKKSPKEEKSVGQTKQLPEAKKEEKKKTDVKKQTKIK